MATNESDTMQTILKQLLPSLLAIAACSAVVAEGADHWSEFQNGGASVASNDLPVRWSPESGVAWRASLAGYGQSTPVIHGNVIYVTSTSGEQKERLHVEAFDCRSGKRLWSHEARNSSPEKNSSYISRAAPSPACDAAGVIVAFEGGNLIALTPEGRVRWQRDLVADYGPISARHGLSSSLAQNGELAFVWIERKDDPYILALAKSDGKTVWKTTGLGATSWSSPRLVPVGNGEHLVCSASGKLAGFDPQSGRLLWTFDDISNNTSCTPMPIGSGRFLIGASDGRGETSGAGAASNGVIEVKKGQDDNFAAAFVWTAKKASSSFGSPVVAGQSAYFVNRAGVLFQLDVESGKQSSTSRLASGSIWATPLVAGDNLYLFGNKGATSVWSISKGKEIAENRLWSEADAPQESEGSSGGNQVLYAASVASGQLILRCGDTLYAITSQQDK